MNTGKVFGVRIGSVILALAFCFGLQTVAGNMLNDYGLRLILLAGLYITLAVSLNLINGITGQFSIGHAAFYMVGAYSSGFISNRIFDHQPIAMPAYLFVSMAIGASFAALAGLVVGLPSLRLKGDYLAIVTLGFGEIIRIIAINQTDPTVFNGSAGFNVKAQYGAIWVVFLLAIVCVAVSRNLLKTAHGLSFLAVREDEVAAQAMGIDLTKTKVVAFIVGAAFAGAAGALFAHNEGFLNPDLFKMEVSFLILTMVVLGGSGSITGSVLAAVTLFAIPELPRVIKFNVSLGFVLGLAIGVLLLVAGTRKVMATCHDRSRGYKVLGVIVGSMLTGVVLGKIIELVPALGKIQYDGNKMRFVIMAVALLVVMLLRPQGVMGHHEFSWDWAKRVFTRKQAAPEASS